MFLPVPNGSRLDIIFKLKQRGSEMHFVDAKWILTGSGGHYGMNIYRGCTHGCIYCDSRSRCYQFTHPFEDIEVKQNAPKLLEKALKSKRKKCMIGTGTMSDPYMHCEENLRLRDIDLLSKINRSAKCVVQMTLTTYDDDLCRILEPNVCITKRRIEVLEEMRNNGIPTIVWLTPILQKSGGKAHGFNRGMKAKKLFAIIGQ